jgi:DNA-directed RNA polymerase specialized sigma24 family protein
LSALADGDAIALAEAYHRTITAAHACARRLLASPVEIEALMRAVYSDLWEEPPTDTSLEGWVRARCFNLGAGYLRQRRLQAPSPSLARYTSGIEADGHGGNDTLEQMISELTEQQQAALVRAHDQGVRTSEQDDPDAGWSLLHAMLALASPLTDDERHAAEMCSSGVALANWTFGLLPPHEATLVPGTAAEPTPCGRLAGVLRRARRRFEPLPPTPDLGHRVLASVLSSGAARQPSQAQGSSLDSDLRVAYADLGRPQPAGDEPTSSLDMHVPAPAPQPAADHGMPGENGRRAPRGWDTGDHEPVPLRPAGPPPAAVPPAPVGGNVTQAFPGASPNPAEQASDDLVRMPLRRIPQRPGLPPPDAEGGDQATSPLPLGDPSILRPSSPMDQDATMPPTGLRERRGESEGERQRATGRAPQSEGERQPVGGWGDEGEQQRGGGWGSDREERGQPPRGLRGMEVAEDGPADSPFPTEGQRRPRGLDTGQRSAPPPRGLDTGQRSAPPPRGLDTGQRPGPPPRPLDSHPGLRRDDSNPRVGGDPFGTDDMTIPPSNAATTAAMPAVRRPQSPPPQPQQATSNISAHTPSPQPPADTESSGGASILRWVVVVVLIALGAAFGIWIGQQMIA